MLYLGVCVWALRLMRHLHIYAEFLSCVQPAAAAARIYSELNMIKMIHFSELAMKKAGSANASKCLRKSANDLYTRLKCNSDLWSSMGLLYPGAQYSNRVRIRLKQQSHLFAVTFYHNTGYATRHEATVSILEGLRPSPKCNIIIYRLKGYPN